jgi:exonuclease SbcC
VYRKISAAVFAGAKEKREVLQKLEEQMQGVVLLSEEEREARRLQVEELGVSEKRAQGELEVVRVQRGKWEALRHAELKAVVARKDVAVAEERWEERAGERMLLDEIAQVEPLRALHGEMVAGEAAVVAAKGEVARLESVVAELEKKVVAAREEAEVAGKLLAEWEERVERWKPDWTKAGQLDHELQLVDGELVKWREAARGAQEEAQAAERRLEVAARELAEMEEKLAKVVQWRVDREHWRPTVEAAGGIEQQLREREMLVAAVRDREKPELTSVALGAMAAAEQKRLEELSARAAAFDSVRVAREMHLLERAQELTAEIGQLLGEIAVKRAEVVRLREQVTEWDQAVGGIEAQLREARAALDVAQLSASDAAERMRHALEEGRPCPVCGSTQHAVEAVVGGMVDTFLQRVRQLEVELGERQQLRQACVTHKDQAEGMLPALTGRLEAAQQDKALVVGQLDVAEEKWAARRQACARELDAATQTAAEVQQVQGRLKQLQQQAQAAERYEQIAAIEAQVGPQLAIMEIQSWEQASAHLKQLCDSYRRAEQAQVALEKEIGGKRGDVAAATEAHQARKEALRQAELDLGEGEKRRERLAAQRALLPAKGQQQAAEEELKRRQGRVSMATQKTAAAEQDLRNHRTLLGDAQSRLSGAREASAKAREAFAACCGQRGVERVAELLAHDVVWRQGVEQELRTLELALTQARAVAAKAIESLEQAQEETAGLQDIVQLEAMAAALDAERAQAHGDVARFALELEQDDKQRAKVAEQKREVEAAREVYQSWSEVDQAIGSATGEKFQRLVQNLTLDHLVHLANHHLAGFSQRYALERVPEAVLGIQLVDREMGDARRAGSTLSGGERFLVSLGLALALSSLEGKETFVDALFIDEGFGSLDGESLDMVMETLEALPGTGRRVGVITHVEGMRERIPVQVQVTKRGAGRSTVQVVDLASGARAFFG